MDFSDVALVGWRTALLSFQCKNVGAMANVAVLASIQLIHHKGKAGRSMLTALVLKYRKSSTSRSQGFSLLEGKGIEVA
ncbi:hypothetical protein OS493_027312 [Desmophyllum pertusum]|uniref:Uncharacterized protein n=1 Tax=Desmophyllum pertusum TaxID=174260 RepID=A0A9W9Z012_9CNID|nr:hypothetical protein OS493_027312 [Desmophyllum pertusum]